MGHPWGTWAPYLEKYKSWPSCFWCPSAQAGLHLPLLELEPTSNGGGPQNKHLASDYYILSEYHFQLLNYDVAKTFNYTYNLDNEYGHFESIVMELITGSPLIEWQELRIPPP